MNMDGGVGPPEKSLHEWRPVVTLNQCIDQRLAGIEGDACHPLHAVHRLMLAQPHCGAAVGVALSAVVHRHERRGPMMLRPIEFDSAGNPRPE